MQPFHSNLSRHKDFGILLIRLVFGFRLIYGTADNLISYEQMLHFRDFLAAHHFPLPLFAAFTSVICQFLAGLSYITGIWIRLFSLLMIINFAVAILMVHLGDTYLNTAPAIHLLVVSAFLLLNGPGSRTVHALLPGRTNNPR